MRLNKNLFFLVFGRILQALLAVATMKLATHYLTSKEMGNYYVLSSIATLFGITLVSPVGQFINRKFHSWHDQGVITKRLFDYNYYVLAISALSIPIIFIAKKYFGFVTDITYLEVLCLSVASIYCNTWFNTIVPALNMLERRTSFIILTLANLGGSLFLSILFVEIFKRSGVFWYLGQYVAFQFIVTIAALIYLIKIINEKKSVNFFKPQISKQQLNSVVKFSVPLVGATFFMWLLNDSYRFIVEKALGLEALGSVAVGLSISASIFALLESLFQQIYYPKFYRKITDATLEIREEACQNLINIAFPAFLLTTIFLSCSSPFVLRLLTSANFSQSFIFIIFGCGISLARVLTNVISTIAHSELSTKKLIPPYAIGGILTVVLITILLHFYHSEYIVGIVLLISNFIVLLTMKHHMFKIIKNSIPWKEIFQILLFSLPFGLEILFWNKTSLLNSFGVMLIFGLYYLFILFKKFARTLSQF